VRHFKPAGVPLDDLAEEVLSLEELESIRLNDLERLDQATAAEQMGISQSTFNRLLVSARFKLARGIVEGKAITIKGGYFELSGDRLRCMNCGQEWKNTAGQPAAAAGSVCPRCGKPCAAVIVRSNLQKSAHRQPGD